MALLIGATVSATFSYEVARVAIASVLAFTLGFIIDTLVFGALRHRPVHVRMRASNWASLPVDTFVFVPIAFAGLFPLTGLIIGQLLTKLGMTEVAIAVYRLGKRIWHG